MTSAKMCNIMGTFRIVFLTMTSAINHQLSIENEATTARNHQQQFFSFHCIIQEFNSIHNDFVSFQQMLEVTPLLLDTQLGPFSHIFAHFSDLIFRHICCKVVYNLFQFWDCLALFFVDFLLCLGPKRIIKRVQIRALGRLLHFHEP